MKNLLITHNDLDGISPIILYKLTGEKFDYKFIEIDEVEETFNELFESDIKKYEHIYVTDLTIKENIYEELIKRNVNILVFDHHKTHEYANIYPFVNVVIDIKGRQTCGTELFYLYLKERYEILNKDIIKHYVDLVRQVDTWNFIDEKLSIDLTELLNFYGKVDFIKIMTRRLKTSASPTFTLNSFEKKYVKLKANERERYFKEKEKKMMVKIINDYKCGIVFAESNKSDLGNYLATNHEDLDLIIIFDTSKSVSYRTNKDNVKVNEFASIYDGGGHEKASGSPISSSVREKIITYYFKNVKSDS